MAWYIKLAIVVGYLVIGAFISGVIGNDDSGYPDLIIMMLWPFFCVIAALMWFFSIPFRIGFRIGSWIYEKFFW